MNMPTLDWTNDTRECHSQSFVNGILRLIFMQVYLKREGSVDGPLSPLQIKDVVLRKYRSVR
jgi:hypothetical protein